MIVAEDASAARVLAETHTASPVAIGVIAAVLILGGIALVLDLFQLRTRWIESRTQQFRDHPLLANAFAEPTEEQERASQRRWMIWGGVMTILMGVVVIWAYRG